MVQFQRYTGCRPQEATMLRPMDLDRSGAVWSYTPPSHKTQHHGRERRIFVGPRAQAVLLPYLLRPADAYCFNPKESKPAAFVPSKYPRRKARGTSRRGERYKKDAYYRAVVRACERAGVAPWSPNQLRHSRATDIRKTFGLEAAQLVLGHARADVTQIYAERDFEVAQRIMGEVG
jgi:integrase